MEDEKFQLILDRTTLAELVAMFVVESAGDKVVVVASIPLTDRGTIDGKHTFTIDMPDDIFNGGPEESDTVH
jgi:hypothetical protein